MNIIVDATFSYLFCLVSKMDVDEGKLPMIKREIVATIAEIDEKYEDLREFETLSKERIGRNKKN
uniref:Uncharacterized protein n=1 Tax=Candidatus Methanophagaceae archaeon ANME-1 ERB6 TaxID=2759912 RepID=A0A7G9YTH1_9EURY|nr:hypothetical protein HDBBLJII_00002 [Methanosarcinales archaeon ANME-1 ERB6]